MPVSHCGGLACSGCSVCGRELAASSGRGCAAAAGSNAAAAGSNAAITCAAKRQRGQSESAATAADSSALRTPSAASRSRGGRDDACRMRRAAAGGSSSGGGMPSSPAPPTPPAPGRSIACSGIDRRASVALRLRCISDSARVTPPSPPPQRWAAANGTVPSLLLPRCGGGSVADHARSR
eukprot:363957-Chlamydomonas_euryale.AAC.3